MSFGNRLRELRLSRELTQADFANAINLGESTISFYESDNCVHLTAISISEVAFIIGGSRCLISHFITLPFLCSIIAR